MSLNVRTAMFDKFIEICKQAYFMPDVRIMKPIKYNIFCYKGSAYIITFENYPMANPVTVYDYYEGSIRYITIRIGCRIHRIKKAIYALSLEIEDFYA